MRCFFISQYTGEYDDLYKCSGKGRWWFRVEVGWIALGAVGRSKSDKNDGLVFSRL